MSVNVLDPSSSAVKEMDAKEVQRHELQMSRERRIELKEAGVKYTMWRMTKEFEEEQRHMIKNNPSARISDKTNEYYCGDTGRTKGQDSGNADSISPFKNDAKHSDKIVKEAAGNEAIILSHSETKPQVEGMQNSCMKCNFLESIRRNQRQLVIALGCALCQNLTGSTVILYYSTEIYRLGGVDNPFLAGVGIGIAKVKNNKIIHKCRNSLPTGYWNSGCHFFR